MGKNPSAVNLGRLGGRASANALTDAQRADRARKAGQARKKALTPEERSEIARKAAKARWKAEKQKPA